jgi:hypothetical protein
MVKPDWLNPSQRKKVLLDRPQGEAIRQWLTMPVSAVAGSGCECWRSFQRTSPGRTRKTRTGHLKRERGNSVTWGLPTSREREGNGVLVVPASFPCERKGGRGTGFQSHFEGVDSDESGDPGVSGTPARAGEPGKPDAVKAARPVWRGGVGALGQPRPGPLPDPRLQVRWSNLAI